VIDPKVRRVVADLSRMLNNYNCAVAVHDDLVKRQERIKTSMLVFRSEMNKQLEFDIKRQTEIANQSERAFRRKMIQLKKLVEAQA
jgi:hypothetical protein